MQLATDFERECREALLNDVEARLVGDAGGLVHELVQRAHDVLREYGSRHDYDVEPVIESLGEPQVERDRRSVTVTIGWAHEAAPFFALGTSDHTIDGNPTLSFIWEDPPQWVREQFDQARGEGGQFQQGWRVFLPSVEVSGLPESRYIRAALAWLRRRVA